jgi:hypothetical protein
MVLLAVSPDGATLLVADELGTAYKRPLWAVPVLGGSSRRLGEAVAQAAAWSPDGQRVVYADGNDIFWPTVMAPTPTSWSLRLMELLISLGLQTAKSFASPSDPSRVLKLRFGRFRSAGSTHIPCYPPGTLLTTNVAADGLPKEKISSLSHKATSGPLRKTGIG